MKRKQKITLNNDVDGCESAAPKKLQMQALAHIKALDFNANFKKKIYITLGSGHCIIEQHP